MKVVLYCCEFAPEGKTGAIRPTKLAKYFKNKGVDVSVIAKYCDNSQVHQSLINDIKNIQVKRVKIKKLLPINDDGFWFSLYSFFELRKQIKEQKPDFIFISVPVFLPMLSATILSQFYKCKLIIDYRDLWACDPYSIKSVKDRLLRWVANYIEPYCMKKASLVNFISDNMKEDQLKKFGDDFNYSVISTGFDKADILKLDDSFDIELENIFNNYKVYSHVGMLDWDMNISEVIKLIKDKKDYILRNNIKFLFVGGKNKLLKEAFLDAEINECCIMIDTVDKITALNITSRSDGVLILGSNSPQRLNRKVFESIAVNDNIFYFGNKLSPTANILKECGYSLIFDDNSSFDNYSAGFDRFLKKETNNSINKSKLSLYEKENLASVYIEKMEELL